ncbi:MAG: RNA 3'-terminal phosphate cyclase [Thermodesulfovibrionales bacterium]
MLEIDGSYGEGGGQILRTSLSLSCALQKPVRIFNIRKNRKRPGLMPQHLACVRALKKICDAKVHGNEKGSVELRFDPAVARPGEYSFDIGTAGSTSLLFQAILPPLLFAEGSCRVTLRGGTHVPCSPPYHYLQGVFIPILERLGLNVTSEMERCGFYPKGGGQIIFKTAPAREIKEMVLTKRGEIKKISGISGVSGLPVSIAERQKNACIKMIAPENVNGEIDTVSVSALSKGTFIFLKVDGDHCFAGFSSIGERGKRAEMVGEEAARDFLDYCRTSASLDHHIADQIVIYLAMAKCGGRFTTSRITQHLLTNLWVIGKFLNIKCDVSGEVGSPGEVSISSDHFKKR